MSSAGWALVAGGVEITLAVVALAAAVRHRARSRQSGERDALTGLLSRTAFEAAVAEALQRERQLAVVKLQLNRSSLLDHLPLDDADTIIVEIANRIAARVGYGDCLARSSDTTFAVLINGEQEAAVDFVHEVMLAAEVPVHASRLRVHATLAAGIASAPAGADHDSSPASLMERAAIALGTVAATAGGIALYTPELMRTHMNQLRMHEALVESLRANPDAAISVTFEPVVELRSGELLGLAARAEWHDDDHPAMSAMQLNTLVQQTGLAPQVDRAMLRIAVGSFAAWRRRWPRLCQQLWVVVRAGTLTSAEPDFSDWLEGELDAADLPAAALILEVPDRPQTVAACGRLRRLREAGVHILVNDALVLAEPVDRRAGGCGDGVAADFYDISPTLVSRCVEDVRARRLVQATVQHAGDQHAATAARQVTALAQRDQLCELGVTIARGPLYGAALYHPQTERLLESAAAGTWHSREQSETLQRRSSRAWQELRHVVGRLPIAAFACDPDGNLIMAEGALWDQLGLPTERANQALTSIIGSLNPSTGRRPLATPLRQALRGTPSVTTVPVGTHWLQVHLSPQREPDRTISGALGVAIDITHRIQAEQALRNSERRFREVFTGAPIGMMIVGPQGQVAEANPAMATMLGQTPADMAGHPVHTLWHPDTPHDGVQQYEALRAGTLARYRAERAYRHRDGSSVWTRIAVAALTDASDPGTAIVVVEDIRDLKQLEVELRHSQKLEAIGMLAAGIAHEINTPIQFISDNTHFLSNAYEQVIQVLTTADQLVRAGGDPTAARRLDDAGTAADLPWLLEQIPRAACHSLEGVTQVADIVRAMRNFGHPDQREQQSVCLNAAIRDTAVIAHNVVKQTADLHLDLDDLPPLAGYPSELNQVVLNLFVNAAHAIADRGGGRGNIRVRTWADEQAAYLSVADDGCGMSADVKGRIFDPFFTTKEVGRGTGQGLTIVYNAVVEKHGGSISVDSAPGAGTTFTIRLPLPGDEFELDDSDFDLLEYDGSGPSV